MSQPRSDTSQPISLSEAIKTSANNLLFETLLKNPEKRAKVLELLTQEGIVGSSENSSPNSAKAQKYNSPIKRLYKNDSALYKKIVKTTPKSKTTNVRLESPSALCRRRALQRLESDSSVEEIPKKLPSPQFMGTPKPFERLLEGVVAYCEIKSNGEDRSASIKTMMESMGARVKDHLSSNVTHVILKDGLYSTYRKAKQSKIHVVSVLWLEAVRRHKFKVPEDKFPAVCADAYQADVTKLCEDIQRDYDDVIQDELNKTTPQGKRRQSDTPISYITQRKRPVKSRSTIYGADCSLYKEPHNRTEIASPYRYKCYEPELSESDSYISVGSNSNKSVDIVPSSQDVVTPSLKRKMKPSDLKNVPEEDSEIVPESNIAQHVKDSFELEKASKIRSPESLNRPRPQVADNIHQRISLEDEDSLRLRVSTDESNFNNSDRSKANTDSLKNKLESSTSPKTKMTSCESNLNLYLANDSICPKNSDKGNEILSDSSSSSNFDNKSKTRRRTTVGLERPTKIISRTNSSKDNITSKSIEKPNKEIQTNKVEKSTRRKTIFTITDSCAENNNATKNTEENSAAENHNDVTDDKTKSDLDINESHTRTRRKSLANIFAGNQINPDITEDESDEDNPKSNQENIENIGRKIRKNIFPESKIQENCVINKSSDKTKNCLEINEDRNEPRKTRQSVSVQKSNTVAVSSENNADEEAKSNLNVRKNRRKTIAYIQIEKLKSPKNRAQQNKKKIEEANASSNSSSNNSKSVENNRNTNNNAQQQKVEDTNLSPDKNCEKQKNRTPNKKIEETNASSDSSADKTRRRVRKLYNPNQKVSVSHINWDEEANLVKTTSESPVKRGKYYVPVKELPKILSAKAEKKVKSIVKKTTQSVPPKQTTIPEKTRRKSARVLNFDTSSSEEIKIPNNVPVRNRRSERIAKTPSKSFKIPDSTTDSEVEKSQTPPQKTKGKSTNNKKLNIPNVRTPNLKKKLTQASSSEDHTPRKRRSTLDFVPQQPKKTLEEIKLSQKSKHSTRLPSIVCTRLHKPETQIFQQIVQKLGGFVIEDEVTKRTTHLIAGDPARTVNLLRAIVRGCWVLKLEWLYKSLEAGKWLDEEDFEMVEFSPSVQKCRLQKQSFGSSFRMDLFISCGPIFISRGCNPRFSDLQELVELCGGRIVRFPRDAQVVVGEIATHDGVVCVNEKWILDSITYNRQKKVKGYLLRQKITTVL